MQGDDTVTLSDVLRAVLDFDGLDAAELAARLGRNAAVVRRWVRGDSVPPVSSVVALADALDAPAELFFRPPATRNEVFGRMLAHRAVRQAERPAP